MQLNGNMVSAGWKIMTGASDRDIDCWQLRGNGTFARRKSPYDIQDLDVRWGEKDEEDVHEKEELKPEEFFKVLQEFDDKKYLMCSGI